MPLCFPSASGITAFTVISFFLISIAHAERVFDKALEEGENHGEQMLSRHKNILIPKNVPQNTLPDYTPRATQEYEQKGKRWTDNPEKMTPETETVSRDPSSAAALVKESARKRPVFVIDPKTDPVIKNSQKVMKNTHTQCEQKETCSQYKDTHWTERKSCYKQASTERYSCSVKRTVIKTPQTNTWRYMTLEFDRNDLSLGFSATINTEGADTVKRVKSSTCVNRKSINLWGNYGGFTIGGPVWKSCLSLQDSGRFQTERSSTCAQTFGETARRGTMPLGDGWEDSLQTFLFSVLAEKFPPTEDATIDSGTIESSWNKARRCGDGDGNGSGRRVSYTATKTTNHVEIETQDGCQALKQNTVCSPEQSRCLLTVDADNGKSVCAEEVFTFRCATGPLQEDSDCAQLRSQGCHQTDAQCLMWSKEDPEFPDPPGKPLGRCLVQQSAYDCPQKTSFCQRKKIEVLCPEQVRCSRGGDCFNTETEQSEDFPKVATQMEMLSDMEKCLATTRDGQSSKEGYQTITDQVSGQRAEPIDCADSSGDKVTIFKGKSYRCDLNLAGFIQNCCSKTGLFRGSCPASAGVLRARRDRARACHYVGIRKKKVLGVTIKKQKVYCCFNSKMAKVVHAQARPQLIEKAMWGETRNGGWGSAKDPECGGITVDQLQSVDFSEIDFSEVYGDILRKQTVPLQQDVESNVEEKIKKLCGQEENGPLSGCEQQGVDSQP